MGTAQSAAEAFSRAKAGAVPLRVLQGEGRGADGWGGGWGMVELLVGGGGDGWGADGWAGSPGSAWKERYKTEGEEGS